MCNGLRSPLTACIACQALFRAFTQLSSLAVAPDSPEAQLALAVLPLLFAAFVGTGLLRPDELAVEEIAAVLSVEAANGFCIMAAADAEDGRRVRGSGVYLKSSRINHGVQAAPADATLLPLPLFSESDAPTRGAACFPNVARFDYFDSAGDGSSHLLFRVQAVFLAAHHSRC